MFTLSSGQHYNISSKISVFIPPLTKGEAKKVLQKNKERELESGIKALICGLAGAIFFDLKIGGRPKSLHEFVGDLGSKQKIIIHKNGIDEWNPFVGGGIKRNVGLRLFKMRRDPFTLEKMLQELKIRGLQRPTLEIPLSFLAQYPENGYNVIFPHEPYLNNDKQCVFCSWLNDGIRFLALKPVSGSFESENYMIAGVC